MPAASEWGVFCLATASAAGIGTSIEAVMMLDGSVGIFSPSAAGPRTAT